MVKAVSHVFKEKYGQLKAIHVNAPIHSSGMDLHVRELKLALVEKFGMSTVTAVNALKPPIGTENNVNNFLHALVAKSLTVITFVFVQKILFGVKIYVFSHHVWEDKYGQALNVFAQLD